MNFKYTDNPSMGSVRYASQLQMRMLIEEFGEEQIERFIDVEEQGDDMMELVISEQGVESLYGMLWSQSLVETLQTMILATGEELTVDDVEEMSSKEFKRVKECSEEALGGTAEDFFEELGINTISMQNLPNQQQTQSRGSSTNNTL